ncbi:MAG: hypothetical protein ACRDLB_10715 [Actinomycetota bacterium]
MSVDLAMAKAFVATHARLIDRRRFRLLLGDEDDPQGALAALDGYRNPDGGYGWGLEPDLRSGESQPAAALHAFEVFAEVGPAMAPHASGLCDWLGSITLPDGGLPFAVPVSDPAGCAPWWREADSTISSLQITTIVAANAHRVARHDPAVAKHAWLGTATDYSFRTIAALDRDPHAFEVLFSLQFLDAAGGSAPETTDLMRSIGSHLAADGSMYVEGGTEDETLRALDFAPYPGRPARDLFSPEVIADELDGLAEQQQADGGWPYEPRTFSPASALEWRGYATVRAIAVLSTNGRL